MTILYTIFGLRDAFTTTIRPARRILVRSIDPSTPQGRSFGLDPGQGTSLVERRRVFAVVGEYLPVLAQMIRFISNGNIELVPVPPCHQFIYFYGFIDVVEEVEHGGVKPL